MNHEQVLEPDFLITFGDGMFFEPKGATTEALAVHLLRIKGLPCICLDRHPFDDLADAALEELVPDRTRRAVDQGASIIAGLRGFNLDCRCV